MPQHRYPGAQPFSTDEAHIFFGRSEDVKALARKLRLEQLVVLHAKSGLGKSSLINAGLIPQLLRDGEFTAFPIRFGSHAVEDAPGLNPVDIVIDHIQSTSPILDKIKPEGERSLWYHLKSRQLRDPEHRDFLLIFDQFEELFAFDKSEVDEFGNLLAEALYVKMPQRFRDERRKGFDRNPNFLTQEELTLLDQPFRLHVLVAIRSDKHSLLSQLKDYLPTIHQAEYELQALGIPQAEDAILLPAYQKEGQFQTPVFDYEDEAVELMLNYLSNDGKDPIESFQLQILCEYLEDEVVAKEGRRIIKASDLKKPEDLLLNYYNDKLQTIEDPKEWQLVRTLIEDELVLEGERRRLSLYKGQIQRQYPISDQLLERLVQMHLLRALPSRRGGYIYELSHDTLVTPVLRAKRQRRIEEIRAKRERERREREAEMAAMRRKRRNALFWALAMFVLALIAVVTAFLTFKLKTEAEANDRANFNVARALKQVNSDPTLGTRVVEHVLYTFNKGRDSLNPTGAAALSVLINDKKKGFYKRNYKGHQAQINDLAVSASGDRFLTGSNDRTAMLWALDGRQLATFTHPLRPGNANNPVSAVAFSPQEEYILTAAYDGLLRKWDFNGNLLEEWPGHQDEVSSLAFAPGGLFFLSADKSGRVITWVNGTPTKSITAHEASIFSVAFHPDGSEYVTASRDGTIRRWSYDSRPLGPPIFLGEGPVYEAVYSPNGAFILAATSNNTALLLDSETGERIRSFTGHTNEVFAVAFSEDSQNVLTGCADNTIKIWDLDGYLLKTFFGHKQTIFALDFLPGTPNGFLSVSGDQTAKLWYYTSFLVREQPLSWSMVSNAGFSSSARKIVVADVSGNSKWLLTTETAAESTSVPVKKRALSSAFSPDGRRLLLGLAGGDAVLYDFSNQDTLRLRGHTDDVQSVAFTPEGDLLTGSADRYVKRWSRSGELLGSYMQPGKVYALAVSPTRPDGSYDIAVGTNDKTSYESPTYTILSLQEDSSKVADEIRQGFDDRVQSLAYSPDGEHLFIGLDSSHLGLLLPLEKPGGRPFGKMDDPIELRGHQNVIQAVAFSPDGRYVLTGSADRSARLWDRNGSQLQVFNAHDQVIAVGFSSSGDTIYTFSHQGVLQVWHSWKSFSRLYVAEFTPAELLAEVPELRLSRRELKQLRDTADIAGQRALISYFEQNKQEEQARKTIKRASKKEARPQDKIKLFQLDPHMTEQTFDELFLVEDTTELQVFFSYFNKNEWVTPKTEPADRALGYSRIARIGEKLLAANPKNQTLEKTLAKTYNSLGWYRLLTRDFEGAEKAIRRGEELDPDLRFLYTNLAPALLFQGEFERGKAMYMEYMDKPYDASRNLPFYRDVFLKDIAVFEREEIIPDSAKPALEEIRTTLSEAQRAYEEESLKRKQRGGKR
jgi:WD40 repeat protein